MIAQTADPKVTFAIGLPVRDRILLRMSVTAARSIPGGARETFAEKPAITRAVAGIGMYAGAFGLTFGAVAAASGLSVLEAVAMSAICFTGASQFALVAVVAAHGSPLAAISAALLLGVRNAFYGVPVTQIVRPRGLRRPVAAHFVIDETTAMAVGQRNPRAGRYAFWATGITLYVCWNLGTLAGALIGKGINTSALGLDAAAPAIFLALVWPQLSRHLGRQVALGAIVVALSLVTLVPAGVPIIAAAGVAIAAGLLPDRKPAKVGDGR
jgi:4-azaleucine resistance transporter AzlC